MEKDKSKEPDVQTCEAYEPPTKWILRLSSKFESFSDRRLVVIEDTQILDIQICIIYI